MPLSHAGLSSDTIVIEQYAFSKLKKEVKAFANYTWHNDKFENILMIVDEHESRWRFEGVAPLKHNKCCLCNVVVNVNCAGGHNLDDEFVCESCYSRIRCNLPPVTKFRQKMVDEVNETEKESMDKDYLKAYVDLLFGEHSTQL